MTADEWARVKALFDAAAAQPPEARLAYLDRVDEAPDLIQEVRELLEQRDVPSSAFEAAVELEAAGATSREIATPDPLVGERVGAYRVVREVNRGGMGTVFLAERDDNQYARRVAIKVMHRGLDTGDMLRRFAFERQILARLDHPNICRLVDAGTTPDGRPYLVQDYIDGERLIDHCDRLKLDVDARIKLFIVICRGVHYAHQRLVAHRDLKPGNILVTSAGEPMLLDFGIAKILDPDPVGNQHPVTATIWRALTPDYASPEQVRGEPITTATDVYSLGVVLFELLTGRSPYRVAHRSRVAIERAVCDQDAPPPSEVVSRTSRLGRRLSGDLDAIVLQALEKDPARRFASAEGLAEDLHRHLTGLPITATRLSVLQRAKKFVGRHRWGVGAAAAIITSLGVGTAVAIHQARLAGIERLRAESRSSNLRALAGSLVFEAADAVNRLDGSLAARQLIVQRGLEYLQILARDAGDDPALKLDLAEAYVRMGAVFGDYFGNSSTGDFRGALDLYNKSAELLEPAARWPAALQWDRFRVLAELYRLTAEARSIVGDTERALEAVATSRRWLSESLREYALRRPGEPAPNAPMVRQLLLSEADLTLMTGDSSATLRTLDAMRAHIEEQFTPPASYQAWGTYYARLGAARHILAVSIHSRLADPIAARALMRLALEDQQKGYDFRMKESDAAKTIFRSGAGQCRLFMGNLAFDLGREAEGQKWIDEGIRLNVTKDGIGAASWGYHWRGRLRIKQSRPAEAIKAWAPADEYFAGLALRAPASIPSNQLAAFREDEAQAYWTLGQRERAERIFRDAVTRREELVATHPTNGELASNLVYAVTAFAARLIEAGRQDDARSETRRVLALLGRQADVPGAVATRLTEYAWLLLVAQPSDVRDPATALAYARRAVDLPRGNHPDAWAVLALAQHLTGDTEGALASALRGYELVPALAAGRDAAALRRDIHRNLSRHPLRPLAKPLWF